MSETNQLSTDIQCMEYPAISKTKCTNITRKLNLFFLLFPYQKKKKKKKKKKNWFIGFLDCLHSFLLFFFLFFFGGGGGEAFMGDTQIHGM